MIGKHHCKKCFMLLIVAILFSCATTGSGSGTSFQDAIEQSAKKIASDIPIGSIVAVVNINSNSNDLSNYIIGELNSALIDHGLTVVSRQSLEFIEKELNFQMSGAVSDETIQSIGKFFGTEVIILGEFVDIGRAYRYRTDAIFVEEARYGSTVRLNVNNDRAMQRMISTLDHQPTRKRNETAEQTEPSSALSFLERGIILAMRGEYDLAIMNFTDAIDLNADLLGAYMLRGRALLASGVSAVLDVGENFGSIITGVSNYEAFTGAYGVSVERHEIYNLAIEDFTQAIRLSPNPSRAYLERGVVYIHKYDYDSAIADFSQAIRFDPNSALAYESRGTVLRIRYSENRAKNMDAGNDLDRAITDLTQAISLNLPDEMWAYYNRGRAYEYRASGLFDIDADLAIADYETVLKIDPSVEVAMDGLLRIHNNRAFEYILREDYDRAKAMFEMILRIDFKDENYRGEIEEILEELKQELGR